MTQRVAHSHAEAAANAIIGSALAQGILWLWGMPMVSAVALNLTFLGVSYARAYVIRRAFSRWSASYWV